MEKPGTFHRTFPNEIFLLIKESIPISDLRTHVCFYHTCRTTASFYGDESEQANFWRQSCLRAGICFTKNDTSYKDVAFETIKKDGFCAHPDCGGTLLDSNARAVRDAITFFGWDPEDDSYVFPEALESEESLEVNRIFSSVAFSAATAIPEDNGHRIPVYLRHGSLEEPHLPLSQRLLDDHPIAWRSLAIFPGVNTVKLGVVESGDIVGQYVSPTMALCVRDIVSWISARLDEPLLVRDLFHLLKGNFKGLRPMLGFITLKDLSAYSTLRGLVSRCSLEVNDSAFANLTGEPIFGMRFSAVEDELYSKERLEEEIEYPELFSDGENVTGE